jgi:DNA-directed RNA polymerase specialized sigma24 family protein
VTATAVCPRAENEFELLELRDFLAVALPRLCAEQRRAIEAKLAGHTTREIALASGVHEGTARRWVAGAVENLRAAAQLR